MPGSNLTRVEAEARKAIVEAPIHYHVDLDLTVGPKNFGSKALICFNFCVTSNLTDALFFSFAAAKQFVKNYLLQPTSHAISCLSRAGAGC